MFGRIYTCLLFTLFIAVACPAPGAAADDAPPLPSRPLAFEPIELAPDAAVLVLSGREILELDQWTRDFAEWQKAADRWLRLPKQRSWAYFLERHPKPEPPVWLEDACEFLAGDPQFAKGCDLVSRWQDDLTASKTRVARTAAVAQNEHPENSIWWRHLHLDGLWSTTQSNIAAFGVFGAHATVEIEGRFQVFVVPGFLLVSIPSLVGTRELAPATDWGITYRLFDIGRSTVHFNLVHAWMLGNRVNLSNANMTLAGFSVSFKPVPKPQTPVH